MPANTGEPGGAPARVIPLACQFLRQQQLSNGAAEKRRREGLPRLPAAAGTSRQWHKALCGSGCSLRHPPTPPACTAVLTQRCRCACGCRGRHCRSVALRHAAQAGQPLRALRGAPPEHLASSPARRALRASRDALGRAPGAAPAAVISEWK